MPDHAKALEYAHNIVDKLYKPTYSETANLARFALDLHQRMQEAEAAITQHIQEYGKLLERCQQLKAWQPIESAPRDGTWILVYLAVCGEVHTAFFTRLMGYGVDGWQAMDGGPCEPTHWQPLPLPPTQEKE